MIVIAKDQVREPLYAVVPYFNPWRHKSRVKHTERALKHFHDSGAVIILVEVGANTLQVKSYDLNLLTNLLASLKKIRPLNVYTRKGIKYKNELLKYKQVKRKKFL